MLPNQKYILDDVTKSLEEDLFSNPASEIQHMQDLDKITQNARDLSAQLIPETQVISATIIAREPLLMCGQAWATLTFQKLQPDIQIQWLVEEGSWNPLPTTLCQISGNARAILTAERTALNFLQTLSGTATKTYHYLSYFKNSSTILLDTRKTLPGLRQAQKYAVRCGGAQNHRMGLYDAILIKENHILACGSITAAIQAAKKLVTTQWIEIEVESIEQLREALAAGPDRIMLDNFNNDMIKEAIEIAKPTQIPLEISGGINEQTLPSLVAFGVNYISIGDLTKSINAIDLSLRVNS